MENAANGLEALLCRLHQWARERQDVRALALAGSWARGSQHPHSDVDLILLTTAPTQYTSSDEWVKEIGGRSVVRTLSWGEVTERRIEMPEGFELDVGVAAPTWARTDPVDPGTARVVSDGINAVVDPDGLLARVADALRR